MQAQYHFLATIPISRLQRFKEYMGAHLGLCPRLLHFAPSGARAGASHPS